MRRIALLVSPVSAWWYGYDLSPHVKRELLHSGCFHGQYGSGLTISSCGLSPLSKLNGTILGGLCVLEQTVDDSQLPEASDFVVALRGRKEIVLGGTSDKWAYPAACLDGLKVGTITVPRQPYAEPLPAHLPISVTAPNPIITAALKTVSATELQNSVIMLSEYATRNSLSIDAIHVSDRLSQQYAAYGFNVSAYYWDEKYAPVIVAERLGALFPDQIVVVGAHYDSRARDAYSVTERAPGADDNGSGSANLLEFGRIIHDLNLKFQYTVRLCAFAGEEQGLLGSRAYAASERTKGTKIVAMFNGDMLGYQLPGKPITLGMKDRFVSQWLLSVVNSLTSLYVPQLPIAISPSCCSDHQSFTENGFNAVGFFEHQGSASDYPAYHTSQDVVENLNFDQMVLECSAIMASAMTFAVPM